VTLLFQPPAYWAGQFDKVNEGSPIDHWMLAQHPLVFVTWVASWITAFSVVLRYLPTRVSLTIALLLILGNASGANSWLMLRLPSGFWIGYGMFVLIAALVIVTWGKAGVLSLGKQFADRQAQPGTMTKRERAVAGLTFAVALALPLAAVLVLYSPEPDPVATFETIQPGMTYQEVQAVLVHPQVAGPLARSFGTPVNEAQAVLRGAPSFEKQEWGRVDSASQYEAEWSRDWRVQNRLPISTSERQLYTVRQWGVANTQSYSFVAVFDEKDALVCRYWGTPTESRFCGWLRRAFGL
jgi:hypothetical protein